jgi:hypothetical protein
MPGTFAADKELFFCCCDRYADRTYLGARSYQIGAKVECQVRAFADSYLEDVLVYELALINTSPFSYQGVYVGLMGEVRSGLFTWEGEVVNFIRREPSEGGSSTLYDMGYWCKRPEMLERIRAQSGKPGLVVPHVESCSWTPPLLLPRTASTTTLTERLMSPRGKGWG